MAKSAQSPIFQFLTQKENLPGVLEVTRYAEEIREYVADRFFRRLEEAIKKNPMAANFSWARKLPGRSDGDFDLSARPAGLAEKGQGLRYTIAANPEEFGMGFTWNEGTRQPEKLCRLESVRNLQAELRKRLPGDIQTEADRWWLWWETWERDPYTDAWSWFGSDFAEWFGEKAKKFWDFVVPTHRLVLDANKALSGSRL